MNEMIERHVEKIQDLIGKSDIENKIDPIEIVKTHFADEVAEIYKQKEILSELEKLPEFKDKTEELKKLFPRDPALCVCNSESIKSYLRNYDPSKGYKCKVFATSFNHNTGELYSDGNLIFDRGTLNFIGARTSRGKTTAMVSMAIDALTNGLPVLFATFEETDVQIYTRMVLNLAYREIIENFPNNQDNLRSHVNLTSFSPGKIFHSIIRSGEPEYNPFRSKDETQDEKDLKLLTEILKNADKKAEEFFNNGQFMILKGYLADLKTYLEGLTFIDRGSVVFSDYIQKIPTSIIPAENRYSNIKQMLRKIDEVVKKNDIISINGAQFGRIDNKTAPKMKDSFTDESFQESSDIEQVGEIEIGIGRDPKKTDDESEKDRMFFSVLKNRQGGNNPALEFDLIDGRKFSYYATNLKVKPHC